jgi:hypothetical protein
MIANQAKIVKIKEIRQGVGNQISLVLGIIRNACNLITILTTVKIACH